jgi:hypothetical protein
MPYVGHPTDNALIMAVLCNLRVQSHIKSAAVAFPISNTILECFGLLIQFIPNPWLCLCRMWHCIARVFSPVVLRSKVGIAR